MRILAVSDTHDIPATELALIPAEAKKRNCQCIIHCGDLNNDHFGHPALGDLPIWVIRTNQNEDLPESVLKNLPANWNVLGDRDDQVIKFNNIRIYIYHYLGIKAIRSNMAIPTPEAEISEEEPEIKKRFGFKGFLKFKRKFFGWLVKKSIWPKNEAYKMVDSIRNAGLNVRYALFGHSHHQFFHVNRNLALINPGAFCEDISGKPKRSFAVIDTKTNDITFSFVHV